MRLELSAHVRNLLLKLGYLPHKVAREEVDRHQTDDEQRDEHPAIVLMGGVIYGFNDFVDVHARCAASICRREFPAPLTAAAFEPQVIERLVLEVGVRVEARFTPGDHSGDGEVQAVGVNDSVA